MFSVLVSSCIFATAVLLCIGKAANATNPETFRIPSDQNDIEIVRGSLATVSFGLMYTPNNTVDQYQLRLDYQSSTFVAGTQHNKEHLFTLDVQDCPSGEPGTKCKILDVRLRGHPDLNDMSISLALYVFRPMQFPQLDTETELQQFTIRIVDPPTTPTPTTPPVTDPSTTASSNEPNPIVGVPASTGSALIGALLGAAFLLSFVGNIIFLVLWCRARSSVRSDPEANFKESTEPSTIQSVSSEDTV